MGTIDHFSVTAAETNPVERVNELLASFSNPNKIHRDQCLKSLIRYLSHMIDEERTDLLHRFGAALSARDDQDINFKTLTKILSSDEDIITLFHYSGLADSILKNIRLDHTDHRQLVRLAQLSEICPIVSIPTLSEDLSSLFRSFLRNPLPYLGNDMQNYRSSLRRFVDVLCNEFMACAIIGCGQTIYETILTSFPSFSESRNDPHFRHFLTASNLNLFQSIVEISQNHMDPLERIVGLINILTNRTRSEMDDAENHSMNLLSQCLQHTATFLNAHPDLVNLFLKTIALSSSPSNTLFRHDRHLSLISTLSQSSSPLFNELTAPILDTTFSLRNLLSTRSFTDPASSFFRLASTNPAFFHRIVESQAEHILDFALSTALRTVRVVSDEASEPHCLDFGRATQNWVVLLKTIAEVKLDLKLYDNKGNSIPSNLLTLLVLSAASTDDDLSSAAVSVFLRQFGLSTPHTRALLFATSTTFHLSSAFTPKHPHELQSSDHQKGPCQSICGEAGRCVEIQSRSDNSVADTNIEFAKRIGIHFAGCLVNALHSTTALPHHFHLLFHELCKLSHQPSVWNDSSQPSALPALTTIAAIEMHLAFRFHTSAHNISHADEEQRDTTCVHLFPFLGPES
ncbi:hypothetical protein BLNAU_1060 [Blattamonas nauphoetae]|uniref:Uncharacterized protein n=1 Tax=Blattamonas nauphoetae TaxID=2049346 RepID=A0ABQ9YK78_9EUKA|nr:hypothetical protein BLNAU_1060 [Blattamonas nauphoetae]